MAGTIHAVTGAAGYSGRHLTQLLLARGEQVRSLTGHPGRPDPFGGRVETVPFSFDDPAALRASLRGVRVLYNTYWVRFDHGASTFAAAVERSRRLFAAAAEAGVERVVHCSITNPSASSPLPYFRGKAEVEAALAATGLSHAVLRPAVFFGGRDVLINNIAWLLRRLPVFGDPVQRLARGARRRARHGVGGGAGEALPVGHLAGAPNRGLLGEARVLSLLITCCEDEGPAGPPPPSGGAVGTGPAG